MESRFMNAAFAASELPTSGLCGITIGLKLVKMRYSNFLRCAIWIWQNKTTKELSCNVSFLAAEAVEWIVMVVVLGWCWQK